MIKPWADWCHTLRKNCETDWMAEGIPEYAYINWCGHTATVAKRHYLTVPDELFERVTGLEAPQNA